MFMDPLAKPSPSGIWRDVPTKHFADIVAEVLNETAGHADHADIMRIVMAAVHMETERAQQEQA